MNKQEASLRLTVLLGLLIALPALGTDLFVPSLPVLARALQVEVAAAQLTITTYFFGLAASIALSVSAYFGDSSATNCFTAFLKGVLSFISTTI